MGYDSSSGTRAVERNGAPRRRRHRCHVVGFCSRHGRSDSSLRLSVVAEWSARFRSNGSAMPACDRRFTCGLFCSAIAGLRGRRDFAGLSHCTRFGRGTNGVGRRYAFRRNGLSFRRRGDCSCPTGHWPNQHTVATRQFTSAPGMWILGSLLRWPFIWGQRRGTLWATARTHYRYIVLIGLGSLGTYLLILYAYTLGPVSYIVAARESSVVIGTLICFVFLGEQYTPLKLAGVLSIAAGLVLIKVG